MFAVKGETLEEYWSYTDQIFQFPEGGANMILDDGGDATLYILMGARVEEGEQLFGPTATNRRVQKALLSMLENQLEALRSENGTEADIAALEAEIGAMREDDRRIPWQDGIPPAITEALTPYRAELDELYCPAMAALELMINERHGPGVESL